MEAELIIMFSLFFFAEEIYTGNRQTWRSGRSHLKTGDIYQLYAKKHRFFGAIPAK